MVNPRKIPNVSCKMQFPFGKVSEDVIILADEIVYGRRLFQVNAILLEVE